jgi:ribosomal protein S18 acetylase RimI-like enzyme
MILPEYKKMLELDSVANMSMLGFFAKHDPAKTLCVNGSLMIQGVSDEEWWYLSCNNLKDFDWFLEQTGPEDRFLAAINDELFGYVKSRYTCRWTLSCTRFYLPNETKLPQNVLQTTELVSEDALHIYSNSHYKAYTSVEYIQEQIKQGLFSGYRKEQKLVGWVLTHDDGALGMLHVLDNYRRQGVARALVIDLIEKVRKIGIIPYTYVEPSNTASMELVKNLGFVPDRSIHWVCLNR